MGTFLDIYEAQIQWYLETFEIPWDYRDKILEAHARLQESYDDSGKRKARLEKHLSRLKNLYAWGDLAEAEYQTERYATLRDLRALSPVDQQSEQRNKLTKDLFEEVRLNNCKVVAVKPRPELEPSCKSYRHIGISKDPSLCSG